MDSMFNTPQEVVQANMNGAVKKAATSKKKVFFMGIMAGVCIALGAQSSNVAMHDISNVGLARLVAGCVFPVGLMMIVFIGGELFTGDCMMTMACIKRKISVFSHPYSGNCIFRKYGRCSCSRVSGISVRTV